MGRIARLAGGFTLLGAGTAMLVLPGPGVLAIIGGLTLLEQDLPWAKKLTDRVRAAAGKGKKPAEPAEPAEPAKP